MKDETTRPATLEDVKLLIKALNEAGAEYILIGGYALYAHGYHRATEDIDILIPKNKRAGEIVKQALLKLPDKAAVENMVLTLTDIFRSDLARDKFPDLPHNLLNLHFA